MKDFIGEYQIDPEVAAGVAALFKSVPQLHMPGLIGGSVDPSKKNSLDVRLDLVGSRPEIAAYYQQLDELCLSKYVEEYVYSSEDKCRWSIVEPGNIQCYPPGGGFYDYHCENAGLGDNGIRRHLVFMTYLCDIPLEEGGGTEFFYQERIYECSLGRTLIWPAAWTHTHRGVPSFTREKLIITGWYSFWSN